MQHEFPDLPYAYDALEPVIDETTMRVHHTKHHKTYFDKFVDAISGTELENQSLEQIFANISQHKPVVRNNAGGFYNHTLFWKMMSPNGGGEPQGALGEAINAKYGSLDEFKKAFLGAATGQFGSGWAWLVVKPDGELEITSTANQDNTLMNVASVQGKPVLGLDVWEHAYYLTYLNKRPDYVDNWWRVVNWEYANELYQAAKA
ncbi:superoxide dismutase [Halomonas sp. IOP_31]|uniref:superoxide dismutase n=1 Tax=Halomonas sp. IOP_31 TaxID=2876584 RepID=UPI001E3F9050|nr:superoxide dismutase [Halomonas sp. IOP_31]MCD6008576.1 superoxide dismutase [Halomonas sp. IOP_31]